jgi:UDP-N-acetylmuramoylalanine--D-glutamate ligase
MQQVANQRVTVFGLGRFGGGIAVSKWLVAQGAKVLVADEDDRERLVDSVRRLDGLPLEFRLGSQHESDFAQADLIVASPAIPPGHKCLAAARAAGVPITTEIRLFVERCPAQVFAVSGTKGKSTTTAMLGEMLKQRVTAHVGGNIGGSLLDKVAEMNKTDLVVLELSSYMLEHLGAAKWSPHVAVMTMIAADHLEWHGSVQAYIEAKKNLLRFQKPEDWAVVNGEDAGASAMAAAAVGRVVKYPLTDCKPFELRTPGRHNQLNAQGAFAAAAIAGVTWDQAQAAVRDFPGLPHRLELIHESGGVRWYNDSIATIPGAAVAALDSFPAGKVIQIIGGKDKHLPVDHMCAALAQRAKAICCIGATGPMLAQKLESSHKQVHRCGDLASAVRLARQIAASGDVVLLSPGYPSQDQFVNFEQRGHVFAQLAREEK